MYVTGTHQSNNGSIYYGCGDIVVYQGLFALFGAQALVKGLSRTGCCLRSPVGNTSSTRARMQIEGQEVWGGTSSSACSVPLVLAPLASPASRHALLLLLRGITRVMDPSLGVHRGGACSPMG